MPHLLLSQNPSASCNWLTFTDRAFHAVLSSWLKKCFHWHIPKWANSDFSLGLRICSVKALMLVWCSFLILMIVHFILMWNCFGVVLLPEFYILLVYDILMVYLLFQQNLRIDLKDLFSFLPDPLSLSCSLLFFQTNLPTRAVNNSQVWLWVCQLIQAALFSWHTHSQLVSQSVGSSSKRLICSQWIS